MADATGTHSMKRSDWCAAGLLVLLVVALLLPLLTRRVAAVYDDCPVDALPGLINTARALQKGSLPLWDFCTYAGGKPPYADNKYFAYYPPMYPLLLLADTDDPVQCRWLLMLLPFALHLVWAALGGYVFGRLALHLSPIASLPLGLLYAVSPEMGFEVVTPQTAIGLSHLPWCMLAVVRYLATGQLAWWLGGTGFLALTSTTGNANYLIRVYFVLALSGGLLWLLRTVEDWRGSRGDPAQRQAVRRQAIRQWLGIVSMFALSIGLSGFSWAGPLEAAGWISDAIPLTAWTAATFAPESSLHPLSVASLFVPGFFGELDLRHEWSGGLALGTATALTGGMFVMTAVLAALVSLARGGRDGAERDTARMVRQVGWVAAVIWFGSLLTMMGRFTPVFSWLCAVLPWFFRFPHPIYYRFAFCFTSGVLAAIGLSALAADRRLWRSALRLCFPLAALWLVLGLFWDTSVRWFALSRIHEMIESEQVGWFLTRPMAYFVLAVVGLCCAARWKLSAHWLAAAITGEALVVAWLVFYPPQTVVVGETTDAADWTTPVHRIDQHPVYHLALTLKRLTGERPGRWVSQRSMLDNTAWYVDGRALLGYSSKPLIPRYARVVEKIARGKNEFQLLRWPITLLRNMNVRYLITDSHRPPWEPVQRCGGFSICELDEPLPYVYTQDRVQVASEPQQLERLLASDLRQTAWMDARAARQLPDSVRKEPLGHDDAVRHFQSLQQMNRINHIDQAQPNSTTIEVQIRRPALLVIAECWHPDWQVTVDGQLAQLHRVNFVQQGVWVDEGQHRIELRFFPSSVWYGMLASVVSGLAVLLVAGCWWVRSGADRSAGQQTMNRKGRSDT